MDAFSKWIAKTGVREVAEMLGITPTSVYNWQYGLRFPATPIAKRVALISGLSLEEIYAERRGPKCYKNIKNSDGKLSPVRKTRAQKPVPVDTPKPDLVTVLEAPTSDSPAEITDLSLLT